MRDIDKGRRGRSKSLAPLKYTEQKQHSDHELPFSQYSLSYLKK